MKITNDILAQYLANKALIKELEEANEVIAIGIKALGDVQTKDYHVLVMDRERQSVAAKKVFDEKMGPGWLEKNGLLATSHYQQVIVVERKKVSHGS